MTDAFSDAVTRMRARDGVDVVVTHFTNGCRAATVRPDARQAKAVLEDCRAASLTMLEFGRITASNQEAANMVVVMVKVEELDMAAAVCAAALEMDDLPGRLEAHRDFRGHPRDSDLVTDMQRAGFDRLVAGDFGQALTLPPSAWTAARLLLDAPIRARHRDEVPHTDLDGRAQEMALRLAALPDVLVTASLLERDGVQVRAPRADREPRTR